jgi:hypothetical protein
VGQGENGTLPQAEWEFRYAPSGTFDDEEGMDGNMVAWVMRG